MGLAAWVPIWQHCILAEPSIGVAIHMRKQTQDEV